MCQRRELSQAATRPHTLPTCRVNASAGAGETVLTSVAAPGVAAIAAAPRRRRADVAGDAEARADAEARGGAVSSLRMKTLSRAARNPHRPYGWSPRVVRHCGRH